MSRALDVDAYDLATVKSILAQQVPEFPVQAFGSRVTGQARKASDLDLAIMTDKPLDAARMADLKEAFSNSDLPFKVDITDWSSISDDFKKIITQDTIVLQSAG